MGSSLTIPLSAAVQAGSQVTVKVYYETTEKCTALQWLSKECVCPSLARGRRSLIAPSTDRRKEAVSSISSVSVSPSTRARWLRCKVGRNFHRRAHHHSIFALYRYAFREDCASSIHSSFILPCANLPRNILGRFPLSFLFYYQRFALPRLLMVLHTTGRL